MTKLSKHYKVKQNKHESNFFILHAFSVASHQVQWAVFFHCQALQKQTPFVPKPFAPHFGKQDVQEEVLVKVPKMLLVVELTP